MCDPCESPKRYSDSIHDRLHDKKLRLTKELETVTAALNALEANPETARVLELISQA